ncbi:hypothetical protein [Streptosporangium lutulentum]|uniref:Immunity protein Imm1 n=1 Tax=Streptosporangium lutulentum TaxID=1461250 RepID=A0ABT9Q975_9ACTN|nr:hypothetical protein [Streptosporangium lutulentum]MDP9843286.1 hypothetical protein [Streptosporangium lutulentum]
MSDFTRKIVDDQAEGERSSLVHYLLTGEHGTIEVLFMRPPENAPLLWQETGGWHGGGLAYHAPFPYQVGQEPRETPCEYVPGGQCFYDVSYTGSESILRQWWDAGRDDDVVWRAAELLYREFFVDMTPEEHLRTPEEFLEALAKLVDDEETGK